MSVRKDVNDIVRAGKNGERVLEDVTLYATTREEALGINTRGFQMASTLTIIVSRRSRTMRNHGGLWRKKSSRA